MARIRTVKPDYAQHRKTRAVTRDARLLNIHLWNLADDEGRLQELPQWIIGAVFPADEDVSPGTLREWLQELSNAGLIERYEVDDERYIQCHDFNDHQVISHPKDSDLPPLSKAKKEPSSNPPVTLQEPSSQEGKGMEQGMEGNGMSEIEIPDAPLSELLASLIAENTGKRPQVGKAWVDAERRLLQTDGRDRGEAERLIRWCQADEFWRANILSLAKFRDKYDQLLLTAKRKKAGTRAGTDSAVPQAASGDWSKYDSTTTEANT